MEVVSSIAIEPGIVKGIRMRGSVRAIHLATFVKCRGLAAICDLRRLVPEGGIEPPTKGL